VLIVSLLCMAMHKVAVRLGFDDRLRVLLCQVCFLLGVAFGESFMVLSMFVKACFKSLTRMSIVQLLVSLKLVPISFLCEAVMRVIKACFRWGRRSFAGTFLKRRM
jgi:hypothetical protein